MHGITKLAVTPRHPALHVSPSQMAQVYHTSSRVLSSLDRSFEQPRSAILSSDNRKIDRIINSFEFHLGLIAAWSHLQGCQ